QESAKGDSDTDEGLEVTKTLTKKESVKQTGFVEEDDSELPKEWKKVGMLKCIYFLVKEMYPQMWMSYIILGITSLVGGKNRYFYGAFGVLLTSLGAIYPVQAILFAAVIDTFALPPDEMTDEGNFYSLMFFVSALVLLVSYFAAGWTL